MAEISSLETGLNDFIQVTRLLHGAGLIEEIPRSDGSVVSEIVEGEWQMSHTRFANEDQTAINGLRVVMLNGRAIWVVNYHATIREAKVSPLVLEFYDGEAAAKNDPTFPVLPRPMVNSERFCYSRKSRLQGNLSSARFAIQEQIIDKKAQSQTAYLGFVIGGWVGGNLEK